LWFAFIVFVVQVAVQSVCSFFAEATKDGSMFAFILPTFAFHLQFHLQFLDPAPLRL